MNAIATTAAALLVNVVVYVNQPFPEPTLGTVPDAVAAVAAAKMVLDQDCAGEEGCGELLAQAREILGDTDETFAALKKFKESATCYPSGPFTTP